MLCSQGDSPLTTYSLGVSPLVFGYSTLSRFLISNSSSHCLVSGSFLCLKLAMVSQDTNTLKVGAIPAEASHRRLPGDVSGKGRAKTDLVLFGV